MLCFFLQGQWIGDLPNGQGFITHSSGIFYEGLWINGKPAAMATRISIKTDVEEIEVNQGMPFALEIECLNEGDETINGNDHFIILILFFILLIIFIELCEKL